MTICKNLLIIFIICDIFFLATSISSKNISKRSDSLPLSLFSEGDEVKKCQERLITLEYQCGLCGADGYYGSNTEVCVKDFQKFNNLTVTGIIDNQTYDVLFSEKATLCKFYNVQDFTATFDNSKRDNNSQINIAMTSDINKVNASSSFGLSYDGVAGSFEASKDVDIEGLLSMLYQSLHQDHINYSELLRQAKEGKKESSPNGNDRLVCLLTKDLILVYYYNPEYVHTAIAKALMKNGIIFNKYDKDESLACYGDWAYVAVPRGIYQSGDNCEYSIEYLKTLSAGTQQKLFGKRCPYKSDNKIVYEE